MTREEFSKFYRNATPEQIEKLKDLMRKSTQLYEFSNKQMDYITSQNRETKIKIYYDLKKLIDEKTIKLNAKSIRFFKQYLQPLVEKDSIKSSQNKISQITKIENVLKNMINSNFSVKTLSFKFNNFKRPKISRQLKNYYKNEYNEKALIQKIKEILEFDFRYISRTLIIKLQRVLYLLKMVGIFYFDKIFNLLRTNEFANNIVTVKGRFFEYIKYCSIVELVRIYRKELPNLDSVNPYLFNITKHHLQGFNILTDYITREQKMQKNKEFKEKFNNILDRVFKDI